MDNPSDLVGEIAALLHRIRGLHDDRNPGPAERARILADEADCCAMLKITSARRSRCPRRSR
jgi:hypothetical protein